MWVLIIRRRDFFAGRGAPAKAYREYSEQAQRRPAGKDPVAETVRDHPVYKQNYGEETLHI